MMSLRTGVLEEETTPPARRARGAFIAGLVCAVGIALSLIAFLFGRHRENEKAQFRIERAAERYASDLQAGLKDQLDALIALQVLFVHSEHVEPEEFSGAAQRLLPQTLGVIAFEWVPRVMDADRDAFEAHRREEGVKDFTIKDRVENSTRVALRRPFYFPISYIEPLDGNEAAMGLDVRTAPTVAQQEESIRSAAPVASARISLVQDMREQNGWIVMTPVYRGGKVPDTADGRSEAVLGFVQAVFRLDSLLQSVWVDNQAEFTSATVWDESISPPQLVGSVDPTRPDVLRLDVAADPFGGDRFSRTLYVDALQRRWRLEVHSTPQFVNLVRTWQPVALLLSGLIITLLLASYLLTLDRRARTVEALVSSRTRDLREANARLTEEIAAHRRSKELREQLETQLRHAQKMEAIGTLAGGIAHDFNNILTAIIGNAEMAQMDIPEDHSAQEFLQEIGLASNRARDLVQRILAVSRKRDHALSVIRLEPVLLEAMRLLRATIPTMVELKKDVHPRVPPVLADASQIHQVIVNLCTNAWHAMDGRTGVIELRLDSVTLKGERPAEFSSAPDGEYARLVVLDNGSGMAPETLQRVFDPFFTTKEVGHGTGLGLAMVHGIVSSHGGFIRVESEPGRGTTFEILFPAAEGAMAEQVREKPALVHGNGQTVVFVDDEEPILRLAQRQLEKLGYAFRGFTDPRAAVEALVGEKIAADVVVTDAAMPGLTGLELAECVGLARPDLPILLQSGHLTPEQVASAHERGVSEVLFKPVSARDLAAAIDRQLGNAAGLK